jgi:hypothetical protein
MQNQIAKYKNQIASRYLPITQTEIETKILKSDLYSISTKYDGHFYGLNFDGVKAELINHGGNIITDLPLLNEAFEKLNKSECNKAILVGELYVYRKGERSRSFDLKAELDEKSENIHFAVFDIISINDNQILDIKEVDEKLNSILKGGEKIYPVKNQFVETRKDIVKFYENTVIDAGLEGVIVRCLNGPTYKIKPKITIDGVILGYVVGEGESNDLLKEILVGLCVGENQYTLLTKTGNGFSDNERRELLILLSKNKVNSDYIEVSGANTAYRMIKPEHVIEFSCIDVFSENSKGIISKMCLEFNKGSYEAIGKKAIASVASPTFLKIRSDKKVSTEEAGISQISKIISLDNTSSRLDQNDSSQLISRDVYVKDHKSGQMVRKFLTWKTNKEHTGNFPKFVFHYTDFSLNRKDVLKKELKISNSEKQINKIRNQWIEDKIKKGWRKLTD